MLASAGVNSCLYWLLRNTDLEDFLSKMEDNLQLSSDNDEYCGYALHVYITIQDSSILYL